MESVAREIKNSEHKMTRVDHLLIADMVEPDSRVLDVGCGDGGLLELLAERKHIDGRGVEISQEGVNQCVARGLSVVQGDADTDLVNYPDNAFDYAILSQTIQATHRPKHVLQQLLRIGKFVIVSFPNFGHWRIRMQVMFKGSMPMTENLSVPWYETPNIHFCTIKDFDILCEEVGATVKKTVTLNAKGTRLDITLPFFMQNLFGEQAVFLLAKSNSAH